VIPDIQDRPADGVGDPLADAHITSSPATLDAAANTPPARGRTHVIGNHGDIVIKSGVASLLYVGPALVVYAVFVLWPLVQLIGLSLQQWDGLSPATPVGLANYAALWADPGFGIELEHSLWWLGVTLAAPVLVGLGLALLLRGAPSPLRASLRALLLIPLLLPTVLIAVAWRLFYNPLSGPLTGLLHAVRLDALAGDWLGDTNLALPALLVAACWASFGLSMLLCEASLAGISPEVLAAAHLDGAGAWARFRYFTLPALRGTLPAATLVTALCAVPSYDLVRLTTDGGPGYATTTVPLDMYSRALGGGGQVGTGAALACLQGAVGLVLALLALLVARGQERQDATVEPGAAASPRAGRRRGASGAAGLVLLILSAAVLFPLGWLAVLALRPGDGSSVLSALGANITTVWGQGFGDALLTSLAIGAVVAAAALTLAVPAAFALAMNRRRLVQASAAVVLALGLFQPAAVLVIPLYYMLQGWRLLDTAPGLVLPQVARALPIAVLLLWMGMRMLPSEILAAAASDGAAPRQVLRYIALPLVGPLVAVVAVWSFLTSWNEYLLPTVLSPNGVFQTMPTALGSFIGRFDTEYGLLATGALLAVLPLLLLYGALYGVLARGLSVLRPRDMRQ